MRSLLALVLLALPAIAHADSFLVMANEDGAHQLEEALRPILADHGISITSMPSPTGAVPLERAAAAQRAAHEAGARAVVWIEGDEIYAVTPDAERATRIGTDVEPERLREGRDEPRQGSGPARLRAPRGDRAGGCGGSGC